MDFSHNMFRQLPNLDRHRFHNAETMHNERHHFYDLDQLPNLDRHYDLHCAPAWPRSAARR
jgi:hypothetical protein